MTRVSERDMYERNEQIIERKVALADALNDLRSVQRIVHGRVSNITSAQEEAMMRDTVNRFNNIMGEAGHFFIAHSAAADLDGFLETITILNEEIKSKFLQKHESFWEKILRFFGRGRARESTEPVPQFDVATLTALVKDRAMQLKNEEMLSDADREALIEGSTIEEIEAYYLLFKEHFQGPRYALFATKDKTRFVLLLLQGDEEPQRHILTKERGNWICNGTHFPSIASFVQSENEEAIPYSLSVSHVAEERVQEETNVILGGIEREANLLFEQTPQDFNNIGPERLDAVYSRLNSQDKSKAIYAVLRLRDRLQLKVCKKDTGRWSYENYEIHNIPKTYMIKIHDRNTDVERQQTYRDFINYLIGMIPLKRKEQEFNL